MATWPGGDWQINTTTADYTYFTVQTASASNSFSFEMAPQPTRQESETEWLRRRVAEMCWRG